MFACRWITLLVLAVIWPADLRAQEQRELARQASTLAVPDFKNKTLEQVQAQAGLPGHTNAMFLAIAPEGAKGGIVVSQSPAPGTTIVRGASRLLITLESPKPSGFANFMNQIMGQAANQPRDEMRVPNLIGDNRSQALQLIGSAGLRGVADGDLEGVVTQQSPVAGREARRGSEVVVTLAVPGVTVPLLDGMTLAEASTRLQQSSLRMGVVRGGEMSGAKVSFQSLPAGSQVPGETPVDLTLDSPETVPPPVSSVAVPSLIGMTDAGANSALASLKLASGRISGPPTGLVVSQTVRPGTMIAVGAQVGFSLKTRQVVVPDVISESEGDARNNLTAFHLFARVPGLSGSDGNAGLAVATETPAAGTFVDPGSVIDLSMADEATGPGTFTGWLNSIPVWVWVVTIAALAGGGFMFRRKFFPRLQPAALSTLASSATPEIRLTDQTGPGIRFAISLRDRSIYPTYRATIEPEITRKVNK